jgi:pimeloyl-ACP methyl ester carboxylesterase
MSVTKVMHTLTSSDGTQIAYQQSGEGPPLVLVHGGISDHSYWDPVRSALEARFGVYAIERRGRGHSGDSEPYAIAREYEDVAAIVASTGEATHLLGHSYGAVCAFEAALLAENLRTLVLYEPPFDPDGFGFLPEFIERLEELLAAGDRDGVIREMMADVVGLSPEELEQLEASSSWPALVATAHTLPRELRSVGAYRFDPERFRDLSVPTVLLEGDQSPESLRIGVRLVDETLRNSRIVTMPGVGHEAVETGPQIFAAAVLDALGRASP